MLTGIKFSNLLLFRTTLVVVALIIFWIGGKFCVKWFSCCCCGYCWLFCCCLCFVVVVVVMVLFCCPLCKVFIRDECHFCCPLYRALFTSLELYNVYLVSIKLLFSSKKKKLAKSQKRKKSSTVPKYVVFRLLKVHHSGVDTRWQRTLLVGCHIFGIILFLDGWSLAFFLFFFYEWVVPCLGCYIYVWLIDLFLMLWWPSPTPPSAMWW